jgi:hypothetical protein
MSIRVTSTLARAVVRLGSDWLVTPSDAVLNTLKNEPGIARVTVLYRR